MIKFDVLARFSGEVKFTAEIDCAEDAPRSIKLGLAVEWGLKRGANLRNADLRSANLSDANLWNADLWNANLSDANLRNANLSDANLWNADLWNADLRNANLSDANLRNADLRNANLRNANLNASHGVNDFVKCVQIEQYAITYTEEVLQIGCQRHPITDWRDFDDKRIAEMDGKAALKFWCKYKDWIFQAIELCPAKPVKGEDQ